MEEMKMRGKLKKFVSALVAAGVLMSGMTVPVFAAERGELVSTNFNSYDSSKSFFNNFWLYITEGKKTWNYSYDVVGGVYGKAANDNSVKIHMQLDEASTDKVATNLVGYTNGSTNMFNDSKYLQFGFDVAMSDFSSKKDNVYLDVELDFQDKNNTNKTGINMLSFSWGCVKLAGQWVDYEYDAETWMRCDYVFYKEDSTVDAYINGVKIVDRAKLSVDISGDVAALTKFKFMGRDTMTGIYPHEHDVYVDNLYAKFFDNVPIITQYGVAGAGVLEVSSKANGISGANNNIIYGGVNMTANELINTINAPEGAELSVVQENKNNGGWRQHHYVGGDNSVEPVVNEDAHPNKLTETWLRVKLPAISGQRIGRVYYLPIVDSKVISTTYADGAALNGYYIPEQPINITVASSANGANVKAMVVQYSKNGELARCETHDFVSALKTPETITFTPAADSGDVKIYLWNDGMQAFDTAQVLNAAP